jgi:hypothetical protein
LKKRVGFLHTLTLPKAEEARPKAVTLKAKK